MSTIGTPGPGRRRGATPRVSVVVPTYNRAGYLPQALDSVLAQTCGPAEIIVVDDGSTDETGQVLRSYGDRITVLRTDNAGVAHARNVGALAATGDYLTFLDSDDLLYPYMLELEARVLDRYPHVAMVYAEMTGFDDGGSVEPYHLKTYHRSAYRDPAITYDRIFQHSIEIGALGDLPASLLEAFPEAPLRSAYFGRVFDSYLTGLVVFQNNMLMRRSLMASVGLRREHLKYWEEVDYILRIARNHTLAFVDVPTYKLRYHPGQISGMTGPGRRYVWARKQQCLLHTIERHALADRRYYAQNRARLNRHLAHLHRAAAVPLMVGDGTRSRRRDLARRARRYLSRAASYGRLFPLLWMLTFCPTEMRRIGAGVIESVEELKHRWTAGRVHRAARPHAGVGPSRAAVQAPERTTHGRRVKG